MVGSQAFVCAENAGFCIPLAMSSNLRLTIGQMVSATARLNPAPDVFDETVVAVIALVSNSSQRREPNGDDIDRWHHSVWPIVMMFPQRTLSFGSCVPHAKPLVGEARFSPPQPITHGRAFEMQRVTLCHVGKHTQRMRLSGREGSLIGVGLFY